MLRPVGWVSAEDAVSCAEEKEGRDARDDVRFAAHPGPTFALPECECRIFDLEIMFRRQFDEELYVFSLCSGSILVKPVT